MLSDDCHNLPIAVYEEGSFFGDIEVFKNFKRYFSCTSMSQLELLALDKLSFKRIFFRQYPILSKHFIKQIEKRWNSIEKILELIENYLDPNKNSRNEKTPNDVVQTDQKKIFSRMSLKTFINEKKRASMIKKVSKKQINFFTKPRIEKQFKIEKDLDLLSNESFEKKKVCEPITEVEKQKHINSVSSNSKNIYIMDY